MPAQRSMAAGDPPLAVITHRRPLSGLYDSRPIPIGGFRLTYDGQGVSMRPSVGNWSFACRSHYWIRDGNVLWASEWSSAQIEAGRQRTLEERSAVQARELAPDARRPVWRRIVGAVGKTLRLTRRSDAA